MIHAIAYAWNRTENPEVVFAGRGLHQTDRTGVSWICSFRPVSPATARRARSACCFISKTIRRSNRASRGACSTSSPASTRSNDLPVYPVAIFSFDRPLRPEPNTYHVAFPGFEPLRFPFHAIQLNRLDWRDFRDQPNPVAAALMAKMHIAPEDRPKVKLECLRLLATLRLDPARTQIISGFIDRYLQMTAAEAEQFAQQIEELSQPVPRRSVSLTR